MIGTAARTSHPISFWQRTRDGAVVAVVTIAIAWPCLWPHYLVSG